MINIADLPAVRAQLEQLTRDVADGKMQAEAPAPVEYARAPAATGPQPTGGRPPATQGAVR